ncbi:hypothetical protein BN1723_001831 [Verticillium longisporum]|uniref:phosphoglycerate dehydrogenase n=1 Tax=Verticillium longisporum TaxID=100787 RepID=A0A0G4KSE8_VERLO|nr:hypothetical protein BN1723_001831 [Verticillium longisporum]
MAPSAIGQFTSTVSSLVADKPRILVPEKVSPDGLALLQDQYDVDNRLGLSAEELITAIPGYHALIVRSETKVKADVLAAGKKLKVVARAGVGVDNIDVDAATQHGIIVVNSPAGNILAAAEHTIALLFATARNTILPDVDFLTIHTPLMASTLDLLKEDEFKKMKKTARVLNVARGGVYNEAALLTALDEGWIAGAGLDVFTSEPPVADSTAARLTRHPKVVATPHLGASTVEAQENVSMDVCTQVVEILGGGMPTAAVNAPLILPEEYKKLQPFVRLIEKMGGLYTQHFVGSKGGMVGGRKFELVYHGELSGISNTRPLLAALVKGLVSSISDAGGRDVNIVNANMIAKERGVVISETHSGDRTNAIYSSLVTLRSYDDRPGSEQVIEGYVSGQSIYISRLDRFNATFEPEGTLLVLHNYDEPGKIGGVGMVLGRYGVNIRFMQVASVDAGAKRKRVEGENGNEENEALMILGVDGVSAEVVADLKGTEGILDRHQRTPFAQHRHMMSTRSSTRPGNASGTFGIVRTGVIGLAKALTLGVSSVAGAPLGIRDHHDDVPEETGSTRTVLFIVSLVLVLLGGAFAGLTIALMGQDSIYLQVMAGDPYEPQSKNAKRVYNLLKKGKHWVLVTLLLSNVIVNETLPVVLDRCLGGGVAAVVGSTVLIVIFGEVVPQSICVRYGLQIGGIMAKPVLVMMWLMAPVAWPTAKLLDWALGEDHGTIYKKSGLKTLVTLHKSLGEVGERLNQDEVTIISAVLDLKDKSVETVMTPMDDVFTMAEDTVLDEKTMDRILSEGYSRIPIHAPGKPRDFVGMLLVKILITYDPEDAWKVKDFPLATLPETRPETSCLDIVNFFQEGKSHMVLVSESPGEDYGALGVVTLEDVIEELIGEEIIDESDVYIDVHKAIRRLTPAPKARPMKKDMEDVANRANENGNGKLIDVDDDEEPHDKRIGSLGGQGDVANMSTSPGKTATFLMRRSSAGPDGRMQATTVPVKANLEEIKRQLKHLGPSNRNTNPRDTKSTTVKIKKTAMGGQVVVQPPAQRSRPASVAGDLIESRLLDDEVIEDENTPLIARPKLTGKGGVHAVRKSYVGAGMSGAQARLAAQEYDDLVPLETTQAVPELQMPTIKDEEPRGAGAGTSSNTSPTSTTKPDLTVAVDNGRASSRGSIISANEDGGGGGGGVTPRRRTLVRSGSISENIVETSSGVRKIVIQAASSDSDNESKLSATSGNRQPAKESDQQDSISYAAAAQESEEAEAADEAGPSTAPSNVDGTLVGPKKKKNKKKKKGGKP